MVPHIFKITVTEYAFPSNANPFAFDAQPKKPISEIAEAINDNVEKIVKGDTLIRGIQSGKYDLNRDDLIDRIARSGSDAYSEIDNGREILFAAPYSGKQTLDTILSGFHEFKPKCEERPQYPVDIWMVFDQNAFENIKYVHPRHNVIANDKWQIKDRGFLGLQVIIVVN